MTETKIKSVAPIYGTAAVWVLYCLGFPLYRAWHFVILICICIVTYIVLSKVFPGTVKAAEAAEEPESTGDEKVDSLLAEGEKSVVEMRGQYDAITDDTVRRKANDLIDITEKIFKKLQAEPGVYNQVKRFSDFFLPTSVKLLGTYERFGQSGVTGENITSTMERIDSALDMTLTSYKKFYDSLFENQALDIETDISVLETLLKQDGLLEKDFKKEG